MTDSQRTRTHSEKYDAIVVGGGIHGVMTTLELVRHGLRPLLLERGEFGAATTANSSCIVHGGLRYLQSFDIPRIRKSAREQQWFLRLFPDLVEPLPCLMPLYGVGLRRPAAFRAAAAVYAALTAGKVEGLPPAAPLPHGSVLSADATANAVPALRRDGLLGGALWHDARVRDMTKLVRAVIEWAADYGATAMERMEVTAICLDGSRVTAVDASRHHTGEVRRFESPVVFNTAGPWARPLSARFGDERPELSAGVLGWNIVLDAPAVSDYAVAATTETGSTDALFFQTWDSGLHVGTRYTPWTGSLDKPEPTTILLDAMIRDARAALPGLDASMDAITRVYAGLLPASVRNAAEPARQPVLIDHARAGGPRGLISYSGVKFTTARAEAERLVHHVFPQARPRTYADFSRPKQGQLSRSVPGSSHVNISVPTS